MVFVLKEILNEIGVHTIGFTPNHAKEEIVEMVEKSGHGSRLALVYIETPANPTNDLIDIEMCRSIADLFSTEDKKAYLAVDNTYMGPLWSSPLAHGADIVVYSATKYIGGHSDLIAGAVLGNTEIMSRVKVLRTFLGNMASPHTCWLLLRSLETLKVRMEQQARNAQQVVEFLEAHSKIDKIHYLGCIDKNSKNYKVYKKQYSSPGAMIAFEIKGGQKEAFKFLNSLKLIKLAVSLGSTESLVQHPATMTHVGLTEELKAEIGINQSLIRLSVGVEHAEDLMRDLSQGLETLNIETETSNLSLETELAQPI